MACKTFVGAAFVNFRSHFGTLSEFSLCGLRFRQQASKKSAFRGAFLFLSTILSTNSHGHWIGFGWIESDEHFEPRCRRQCTEH